MIELVIKIDCEKTEKAFKAVCEIMDKSGEKVVKDWLDLNGVLTETAKVIARNEEMKRDISKKHGDKVLKDLFGIFK